MPDWKSIRLSYSQYLVNLHLPIHNIISRNINGNTISAITREVSALELDGLPLFRIISATTSMITSNDISTTKPLKDWNRRRLASNRLPACCRAGPVNSSIRPFSIVFANVVSIVSFALLGVLVVSSICPDRIFCCAFLKSGLIPCAIRYSTTASDGLFCRSRVSPK